MSEKRGMTGGLMLAYVLVAGCASIGNADVARDEIMSRIHVGETTRQQVMTLLGEPDSRVTIDVAGVTREWWSYTYESAVINPIDYLLLYGFFFNGIGLYDTRYDVGVFFDQRGFVSTLSQTKTDFDMGRPFTSLQVSSVSHKTTGSGLPDKAVHFEDRMEYRY